MTVAFKHVFNPTAGL